MHVKIIWHSTETMDLWNSGGATFSTSELLAFDAKVNTNQNHLRKLNKYQIKSIIKKGMIDQAAFRGGRQNGSKNMDLKSFLHSQYFRFTPYSYWHFTNKKTLEAHVFS